MKPILRDGVIHANGLSADFRFMQERGHESLVQTAAGNVWVDDSLLTYDPVRDLSPEAAAVVAKGDNL